MLNFQMQRGTNVKLPEVLKMAVESGDWQLVCDVYTNVTGLPLSPPQPKEMDWAGVDIDIDTQSTPTPDFTDNTEPIIDDNIAKELVQDEGNNIGEHDSSGEEFPFSDDESKSSFIASSKSGKPQRGLHTAIKQKMLISQERTNRFTDNLDAFPDERVDINPAMGVPNVSERSMRGNNQTGMIEVICVSCNKTQTISSVLASGYSADTEQNTYKCNGCIIGRRKTR